MKPIRLLIFLFATLALAKLSFISLFMFFILLFTLGYWVYADEKEKGNLRVKFGLYEWVYKLRKQK